MLVRTLSVDESWKPPDGYEVVVLRIGQGRVKLGFYKPGEKVTKPKWPGITDEHLTGDLPMGQLPQP